MTRNWARSKLTKLLDDARGEYLAEHDRGRYHLKWRSTALYLLGLTKDPRLLPSIMIFIRMNGSPEQKRAVPQKLFKQAIPLVGVYHEHEQRPALFKHLCDLLENVDVRLLTLKTLKAFLPYSELWVAFAEKLLEMHKKSKLPKSKISLDILMDLHGKIEHPQIKAQLADAVQSYLFTSYINVVYPFLLAATKEEDRSNVELDISIYVKRHYAYLNNNNRGVLNQRIMDYGDLDQYLKLLLFSTQRDDELDQSIIKAFDGAVEGETKPEVILSEAEDIARTMRLTAEHNLSDKKLFTLLHCLSDDKYPLTPKAYEFFASKLGTAEFVFEVDDLKEMKPPYWADDVDHWESEIGQESVSIETYRSILDKDFKDGLVIYESLKDVFADQPFSNADKDVLLGRISDYKDEYNSLLNRRRKGERGLDSEIQAVEANWERSFELIPCLQRGQNQLAEVLRTHNINPTLMDTALDLYLDVDGPDVQLLGWLFDRYPKIKQRVLEYFSLQHLSVVVLQNVSMFGIYQSLLTLWHNKISALLEDSEALGSFLFAYSVPLMDSLKESVTQLQEALTAGGSEWAKNNKSLLYRPLILELLHSDSTMAKKELVHLDNGLLLWDTYSWLSEDDQRYPQIDRSEVLSILQYARSEQVQAELGEQAREKKLMLALQINRRGRTNHFFKRG
ncbi:MAG: hypothetical protein CMK59_02455 [Proteobacteria bacterium]|nr:hypothetical protein [Pseudomonadota bacterium]